MFHDTRIKKKCSIITDLDQSIIDATPNPSDPEDLRKFKEKCQGSESAGIARKARLGAFTTGNSWIDTFFAPNTFEVDFVTAGNTKAVVDVIDQVYKDQSTIAEAKAEINSGNIALYGKRVLTMAKNQGKGWFAILLGNSVNYQSAIPSYILDAIFFAHPNVTKEVWGNVLSYRLCRIADAGLSAPSVIADIKTKINSFKGGKINLNDIRGEMIANFPDDQINKILEKFPLC